MSFYMVPCTHYVSDEQATRAKNAYVGIVHCTCATAETVCKQFLPQTTAIKIDRNPTYQLQREYWVYGQICIEDFPSIALLYLFHVKQTSWKDWLDAMATVVWRQ